LQDFNLNALRGFIFLPCGEKVTTTQQTTTNKTTAICLTEQTKNMKNKKTFNMKKPICVRSSVHVKPAASFNEWQQSLKEERDFLRLIDGLKSQVKTGRTI